MKQALLLALTFTGLACAGENPDTWRTAAGAGFTLQYRAQDARLADLFLDHGAAGIANASAFFGQPVAPFTLRLFPDRAALTAYWREMWRNPGFQAECWMIASGDRTIIAMLSPGAWPTEACGHDPNNAGYVRRIVMHEVVHVLHR